MGKTYGSGASLSQTFQMREPVPLDDRETVDNYEDLALLNAHIGLRTYVKSLKKSFEYDGTSWHNSGQSHVCLTEDEYNSLEIQGKIDNDTLYLIFEDDEDAETWGFGDNFPIIFSS